MATARRQGSGPFLAIWLTLSLAAWALLLVWSLSPGARLLSHDTLGDPSAGLAAAAAVLMAGWLLMLVAMMLPTVTPLVLMFRTVTRTHDRRALLVAVLGLGYVTVWLLFGLVIHALDSAMHATVDSFVTTGDPHVWITASVFAIAGVFELTPLKYVCLDRCRTPRSFIVKHWTGVRPTRSSFLIGAEHGLFCVGCCWALMTVMFAVGLANIGWMLVLASAMALEKNVTWGRKLVPLVAGACFTLAGAALIQG